MDQIKRLLIIRLSAMGDVILTTPMLRWVKQRFPELETDIVVKDDFAQILKNHPDVSDLIIFPSKGNLTELIRMGMMIRSRRYHAVIDLQANFRSRCLAWLSGAKQIAYYHPQRWKRLWLVLTGINTYREIIQIPLRYLKAVHDWGVLDDGMGASIFPSKEDEEIVHHKLQDLNHKTPIVLAPGAAHYTKRWPASFYSEVGRYFSESGYGVVLAGGENDMCICKEIEDELKSNCINLCGQLKIMETAALLKQTCVVITNDTGVMHVAGAVGSPVAAIFGPTTHHFGFFPFRSISIVIEHMNLNCRPCSFHGSSSCPRRHFRCMLEISPERVVQAVKQLISL